jgi:5-formyltetrahydrofolate cyclo-ligase
MPWLQHGRPIGAYAAVGTEVDTAPLLALALRRGCPPYLPRIVDYRHRRMRFARMHGAPPSINRHGIPEPDSRSYLPVLALAVVFVPLLGFDARGTRLGSGAGYYDRLFAFRRRRIAWQRPLLIGLAYRCQQLPHIERRACDVPLDLVVTEAGIIRCES